MIVRRLLGILFLLIAILTVVLVAVGLVGGRRGVDTTADQLDAALATTGESLDTVIATLETLDTTMSRVSDSLDTVEASAHAVAVTISDTQPLLNNVETIASDDIAGSLETIEDSIPSLVGVAGAVDDTLTTLDAFQFAQEIPLGTLDFGAFGEVQLPTISFGFDLGIDYEPEQPFDESVQAIGNSLDGVPEQLRDTALQLGIAADNLSGVTSNLDQVAADIAAINASLDGVPGQLATYVTIVGDVQDNLDSARERIPAQAARLKNILTVALVWLGLTQLAPAYLGFELLTGRREPSSDDDDADRPVHAADETSDANAPD